jgi:hypothetical protein
MSLAEAAPPGLREGVNDPSPITRVIALDWYDGPTGGVLQVGDAGPVYRFIMLDERQLESDDDTDLRVYGLYPLPADALTRLTDAIAPYMAPRWPVWFPVWKFPSDEIRQTVEAQTDGIINQAGPLTWVVVGDLGSGPVRALPVRAARAS